MLDENKHKTTTAPHQGLYLEEIWHFQASGQNAKEKKNPKVWVSWSVPSTLKLGENEDVSLPNFSLRGLLVKFKWKKLHIDYLGGVNHYYFYLIPTLFLCLLAILQKL